LASRRLQKSGLLTLCSHSGVTSATSVNSERRAAAGREPSLDEPARNKIAQIPGVVEAYPDIRFVTEVRFDDKPHLTMVAGIPFLRQK